MVPKPAIPARISSSGQEDRGTNITATDLTGGMVPNLEVADPVGTKAHGPQNNPKKQVIDLTEEPDEDLQKALVLSLQEEHERNTGFISQEQADINRAVAASMSDGTVSRRTVAFREAENPRDKIRMDNWPVGLKNVGNTCWFSAVIQSLFYVPEFRRLVLEFTPHKIESKDLESRELRNVSLVTNLRRLFALMLRGRRKYLDPSECISILRSGLGDTFSQHDVSETTHLLLQWLEEAFSLWNKKLLEEEGKEKGQMELEIEIERKGENSSCIQNPLIDLFYGQLAVETVNGNHIDGRTEQYSQCIIQVSGMSDLHEGIEAFTKESVEPSPMIETNQNSPSKAHSSQSYRTLRSLGLIRERWFLDLPPVLTFELKRFLFNSVSKRPEKIHDRVLFPKRIYMDRYLQRNREKVVELRTIADDLLVRKQQLKERIQCFDEFGNETEKYSLPRVLRYTRRFIESRRTRTQLCSSQPTENTRQRTVASTSSPHRRKSFSATDLAGQESDPKRCRVLTNDEFHVIDTCLDEMHEEICKDLEQLGKEVAEIDARADKLYDKPDLKKVAYDLHAVMVHGGEAASGHYWSYIWDQNRDTWLKFNDHLVTEACWTELEKDAYGGPHTKASAYCLIYVDEKKRDNLLGSNFENELPLDLLQFVEEDSKKLDEEYKAWDDKQKEEAMEVDETSTVNASNTEVPNSVVVSLAPHPAEPQIDFNKWELAPPGSNFTIEQSSLEKVHEHQNYASARDRFNAFFQHELTVYENVASSASSQSRSHEDRRVDNFVCYLVANGFMKYIQLASLVIMNRFLALTSADSNREHLELLEITTNEMNDRLKVLTPEDADELMSLNNSYKGFLIDVHAFIYAVKCILELNRYDESIPVLSRVYFDGRADRELGANRRIHTSVIFACLRKPLQDLNAIYISKFRDGKGSDELAGEIQQSLVPGLVVLSQSKAKEDETVVERLRGSWCALLDGMGDVALEKILTLILDCRESRDLLGHLPSTPINRIDNLPNLYKEALNIVSDKS